MNARRIEYEMDDDEFQDYLDDLYGGIDVCGKKYYAGFVWRKIDPVSFRLAKMYYEDDEDKWACGVCNKEYDTEREAESCCKDAS